MEEIDKINVGLIEASNFNSETKMLFIQFDDDEPQLFLKGNFEKAGIMFHEDNDSMEIQNTDKTKKFKMFIKYGDI